LLKQAGYEGKRIKTSELISTSGSGQMLPLPMNEFMQESLREVGIDLELIPMDWNALLLRWRKGFQDAENANLGAMNVYPASRHCHRIVHHRPLADGPTVDVALLVPRGNRIDKIGFTQCQSDDAEVGPDGDAHMTQSPVMFLAVC
jgi:hypothetical protein